MAERCSRPPSILLEPPPKGVELDDPGAQPSCTFYFSLIRLYVVEGMAANRYVVCSVRK